MTTELELTMLEAISRQYSPRVEHKTLARLNGDWQINGEWHLVPGSPTIITGQMENRGILGGHFIESRSFFEGIERSRVIYGYDPEDGRFMAFAISALAARCDLEHGQYNMEADILRFSCVEYVGSQQIPVQFERTLSFLSEDAFDLRITYPEREADQRLGMELRMRRCGVPIG